MANVYGRQVIVPLTNKSGGGVIAGDVVILDSSNNDAFTTTTSAGVTTPIGVAQETIANNATGRVLVEGYAALVNVNASVTRLHYGKTHTVAKQATDAGASRVAGTFCCFLSSGTTPDALVYPVDLAGAALTNPMTNVGDIIYGGSSGTPTRLADVATGSVLISGGVNTAPAWGYPTLTVTEATLSGNVTMTTSGTLYDGPSMTLAAGTYILDGQIAINPGTLVGGFAFLYGRIDSGGTAVYETETLTATGGSTISIYLHGYLVLGGSTTVKLRASDQNNNNATMLRDTQTNSASTHTATYLRALRIA